MPRTPRSIQTRSRQVLSWALGLVIAIQLGSGLLLDYVFPLCRYPQARHVLGSVPANPEEIDVVFLGSSRFVAGIHSAEIRRLLQHECPSDHPWTIFNGAVLAGDQLVSDHLFDLLQKKGVRPRWLVLEVSPETLSRHTEWLGYHLSQMLRWDDLPSWAEEICKDRLLVRTLGYRLAPLCYYRATLLHQAGIGPDPNGHWDALGRLAAPSPEDEPAEPPLDFKELLRLPEREPTQEQRVFFEKSTHHLVPARWLRDYRAEGKNVAALERLLRRCRSEQIQVVLIGIPVTEPHRRLYTPQIETAYRGCLARLCRSYGCRFVCCRDWVPDVLFTDNHHLDPEGKLCFSRLLALRVLVPLLKPSGTGPDGLRVGPLGGTLAGAPG